MAQAPSPSIFERPSFAMKRISSLLSAGDEAGGGGGGASAVDEVTQSALKRLRTRVSKEFGEFSLGGGGAPSCSLVGYNASKRSYSSRQLPGEKGEDEEATTTGDVIIAEERAQKLQKIAIASPQQQQQQPPGTTTSAVAAALVSAAFERGLQEGADRIFSLLPETLADVERVTRMRCLQEVEDDRMARRLSLSATTPPLLPPYCNFASLASHAAYTWLDP